MTIVLRAWALLTAALRAWRVRRAWRRRAPSERITGTAVVVRHTSFDLLGVRDRRR